MVRKSNTRTPTPPEQIKVEPSIAMVKDLLVCRGGPTAHAMGWLKRGGGSRALVGSIGEVGISERGMQDIPRFGALRRDNTPSLAEVGLYVVVQSCSCSYLGKKEDMPRLRLLILPRRILLIGG